jgi:uncharacterized OsmC-like protein
VRIIVQHVEALRFQATVGEHIVSVDAAPEDGGAGAAPSAPQLFAAAVGACMLDFVANSCQLHGVPFERLSLEVEYEEQAQPRRIGTLEATLRIEPQPPEDVKRRLVGVAHHATLVNTLMRPPEVVIRFAEGGDAKKQTGS